MANIKMDNPEKIAIVGLGWLGLPLAKHFISKGFQVAGTVRSEEKKEKIKSEGIPVAIWNSKSQNNAIDPDFMQNSKYCIINIPPGKINSTDDYANDCINILPFFSTQTKFIFISSTGIYPENIGIAIEDQFDRKKHLDNHIALAEQWLDQKLNKRLTILRMAGLIGVNRHPAKFLAGKKDILNGLAPVNLIHLTDCIQLIEKVIEKSCWGEVINGCSNEHPSRKDYYTKACQYFGMELPDFKNDVSESTKLIDNSKSKLLLKVEYQMSSPYDYWRIN